MSWDLFDLLVQPHKFFKMPLKSNIEFNITEEKCTFSSSPIRRQGMKYFKLRAKV